MVNWFVRNSNGPVVQTASPVLSTADFLGAVCVQLDYRKGWGCEERFLLRQGQQAQVGDCYGFGGPGWWRGERPFNAAHCLFGQDFCQQGLFVRVRLPNGDILFYEGLSLIHI